MEGNYNLRNPAVKRLMREAQELKDPTEQFSAHPLDDNLFEWHFTIRGPAETDFADGFYHGRIILPPEYPMKPPSIILLTPSGRFETNKKICLSISGYHPETWLPSWSLRTALLGIIGFLPSHGGGAIGSLDYSSEERKILAKKSQDWRCPNCGHIRDMVLPVTKLSQVLNLEAKKIAQQINLTGEKSKNGGEEESTSTSGEDEATTSTEAVTATTETPAVTATTAVTTTATDNAATVTTSSYPASMTYQLPPYNLAQSYPFPFPPFHRLPTTSQQQASPPNPNLFPQQLMWPYQQNLFSSSNNPSYQFFNPPFASFPRMNPPFSNHSFYPFSSISTTSPLTVITSLTSTTLSATATTSSIPTTSTFSTNSSTTPSTTSTTPNPSTTLPLSPSTQEKTTKAPTLLTNASSNSTTQSPIPHTSSKTTSAPSPLEQSSTVSSTCSPENELRHRFKPATTTITASSSSLTSSTIINTPTTPTTNTPASTPTTPRVTRTNINAEPSRRPNFHTGSNFLDAVIDLCVIFILFCIFALLSRRVFLHF